MANVTPNYNKYKPASSKGFFGIMKAVVTRNYLYMPKPIKEDDKKLTSPYDVQIWIPSYHGMLRQAVKDKKDDGSSQVWKFMGDDEDEEKKPFFGPDPKLIGTKDTLGSYPWAQVCAPIFKDQVGDRRHRDEFPDVWSSMFYGKYNQDLPTAYPAVGDIVFVMFENGDSALPVVIGSLLCERNKVRYKNYEDHDKDYLYYEEYEGYAGNVIYADTQDDDEEENEEEKENNQEQENENTNNEEKENIVDPLLGGSEYTTILNLATRLEGIDVENEDLDEDKDEKDEDNNSES